MRSWDGWRLSENSLKFCSKSFLKGWEKEQCWWIISHISQLNSFLDPYLASMWGISRASQMLCMWEPSRRSEGPKRANTPCSIWPQTCVVGWKKKAMQYYEAFHFYELFCHLFRGSKRVLRRDVLNVVGQGIIGEDGLLLVDLVHGIFERELRGRVFLIVWKKRLCVQIGKTAGV